MAVSKPPTETGPGRIKQGVALRNLLQTWRREGRSVGLVPTMGSLHEGHLSLVDAAVAECDMTVATIFVNPAQFDNADDLAAYPRDAARDEALLGERGCDLVFLPDVPEIYPPDYETYIEVGQSAVTLEGQARPGHFRGVATVVMKLLQLAPADRAYFGRKDYQQTLVVRRMVEDFNVPVEIRVCDTVREADGLAMSSRNARLNAQDRERARALIESLRLAAELVRGGERDAAVLEERMHRHLTMRGVDAVDYVQLVAEGTVSPVTRLEGPTVALVAARLGKTRLIDNLRVL